MGGRGLVLVAIALGAGGACDRGERSGARGRLPYLITEEDLRRYLRVRDALEAAGIPARAPSDCIASRRRFPEAFEAELRREGLAPEGFLRLVAEIDRALRFGEDLVRTHEKSLEAMRRERDALRDDLRVLPADHPERAGKEELLRIVEDAIKRKEATSRSEAFRIFRSNAEMVRRFRERLGPGGPRPSQDRGPPRPASPGRGPAGTGRAGRP